MPRTAQHRVVQPPAAFDPRQLMLDPGAIDSARRLFYRDVLRTAAGHWRDDVIDLLEDSLAAEMMCVMNFMWHRLPMADELPAPQTDGEAPGRFGEFAHALRLARHIVQLGGTPHFSTDPLGRLKDGVHGAASDLEAMVLVNLAVERVAIERYGQIIRRVGRKDSTSRRLIEAVLDEEEEHAQELEYWLAH
jgi:bacterioferritin